MWESKARFGVFSCVMDVYFLMKNFGFSSMLHFHVTDVRQHGNWTSPRGIVGYFFLASPSPVLKAFPFNVLLLKRLQVGGVLVVKGFLLHLLHQF